MHISSPTLTSHLSSTSRQTTIWHFTWLPWQLKYNLFKTNSWFSCLNLFLSLPVFLISMVPSACSCQKPRNQHWFLFPSLPKLNGNKLKYIRNSVTSYYLHLYNPSPSHHHLPPEMVQLPPRRYLYLHTLPIIQNYFLNLQTISLPILNLPKDSYYAFSNAYKTLPLIYSLASLSLGSLSSSHTGFLQCHEQAKSTPASAPWPCYGLFLGSWHSLFFSPGLCANGTSLVRPALACPAQSSPSHPVTLSCLANRLTALANT